MVVIPDGMLVMCHMAKDHVTEALVHTSPTDHNFLLVVVTKPPKSLGPPIVVLVQQTSDNPVDVPESLDKFGIFILTLPGTFHPSDRQYVHRRCGNAEVIT